MKTTYKAIIACIFFYFFSAHQLSAQESLPAKVLITGTMDSVIEAELFVHGEYFIESLTTVIREKKAIKDGVFKFSFTPVVDAVYITLQLRYPKGGVLLEDYIVNRGDSLVIHEKGRRLSFEGNAADKFRCQLALKQIQRDKAAVHYASSLRDSLGDKRFLALKDSTNLEKVKLLVSQKYLFTEAVYEQLKADCLYDNNYFLDNMRVHLSSVRKDSAKQLALFKYYKDNFLNINVADFVNPAFLHSKKYIFFLLSKIKSDNLFRSVNFSNYTVAPNDASAANYREIDSLFSGELREVLITTLFKNLARIDESASTWIHDSIKKVKNPFLRDILIEVETKTAGATAYNFSLRDQNNKIHRLSDYKGKVVVLDLWYTGCIWCTVMADMIRPLASKKDSGVVFISISIDKEIEKWKTSVLTNVYTSPDEINLYTNGEGHDHAFIKYYQIHQYPTVFIIDKLGKISSFNPAFSSTNPDEAVKLENAIAFAKQ